MVLLCTRVIAQDGRNAVHGSVAFTFFVLIFASQGSGQNSLMQLGAQLAQCSSGSECASLLVAVVDVLAGNTSSPSVSAVKLSSWLDLRF